MNSDIFFQQKGNSVFVILPFEILTLLILNNWPLAIIETEKIVQADELPYHALEPSSKLCFTYLTRFRHDSFYLDFSV